MDNIIFVIVIIAAAFLLNIWKWWDFSKQCEKMQPTGKYKNGKWVSSIHVCPENDNLLDVIQEIDVDEFKKEFECQFIDKTTRKTQENKR